MKLTDRPTDWREEEGRDGTGRDGTGRGNGRKERSSELIKTHMTKKAL